MDIIALIIIIFSSTKLIILFLCFLSVFLSDECKIDKPLSNKIQAYYDKKAKEILDYKNKI